MKKVAIIGAGPAGLSAAYELVKKGYDVVLFESEDIVGGISKTIDYQGNKIDLGGHRFFSKIDRVNRWWHKILEEDFLLRSRKSRIYFERKFYNYPISLNLTTIKNLGLFRMMVIGLTYIKSLVFKKKEYSLEEFFINRFGSKLYETFFKDYTYKVWGVPCDKIDPLFGYQRVKGLSISTVLSHAFKKLFRIQNKQIETSLIEEFSYPKYGPGQLWQRVADIVVDRGAKLIYKTTISQISKENDKYILYSQDQRYEADIVISSMALKDLYKSFDDNISSAKENDIAKEIVYRDFITVGLLLKEFKIDNIDDNWIYIQENDVLLGRVQFFNNWSPYLVNDKNLKWVGLEYFCQEGDKMWSMPKEEFISMAIKEFEKLGFIKKDDVVDSTIIYVKKAYPSYFGSYKKLDILISHLKSLDNFYCIGRNGQHRYNNMDHSMMSAFEAVDIIEGLSTQDKLWSINTEKEYHESK